MLLTITGASDDLIEVDGGIVEEFNLQDDEKGDLLAFSDGTILRIAYSDPWRITPVVAGTAALRIDLCTEDGEDDGRYTDRAYLNGDITWVVQGVAHATPKRSS